MKQKITKIHRQCICYNADKKKLVKYQHNILMDSIYIQDYVTFTQLLGVRDSNLSPYRDARVRRYKSVQKMMDLIELARKTYPHMPSQILQLDADDPEWDDIMPFPLVDHSRLFKLTCSMTFLLGFYAYNYNTFTYNIRFRLLRNFYPLIVGVIFWNGYTHYRRQILKVNLFDEYCHLRTQELVQQNEYLLEHEDIARNVYWREDFLETMKKVYRQANDNEASDFKDSELLLQDFLNRYTDPSSSEPMKNCAFIA